MFHANSPEKVPLKAAVPECKAFGWVRWNNLWYHVYCHKLKLSMVLMRFPPHLRSKVNSQCYWFHGTSIFVQEISGIEKLPATWLGPRRSRLISLKDFPQLDVIQILKSRLLSKKDVQDHRTSMTFRRKGGRPTYFDLEVKGGCFDIVVKISVCICVNRRMQLPEQWKSGNICLFVDSNISWQRQLLSVLRA